MTPKEHQQVEDYLISVVTRFNRMYSEGRDIQGLGKALQMAQRWLKTQTITPGEFQYIYDRTHPLGKLPTYNYKGRQYGLMMECPATILISHVVDWSIPHSSAHRQIAQDWPQLHGDIYNTLVKPAATITTDGQPLFEW
jgi:hypothetical protein